MFYINHSFFLFIMMEKGVYLSCQDEEKISTKEKTDAGKHVTKKVEPKMGQLSMDFCTERVIGRQRKKASGITEADANEKKQELFCISDTGVKQSVVGVCAL